jgi:hypothetical protein
MQERLAGEGSPRRLKEQAIYRPAIHPSVPWFIAPGRKVSYRRAVSRLGFACAKREGSPEGDATVRVIPIYTVKEHG